VNETKKNETVTAANGSHNLPVAAAPPVHVTGVPTGSHTLLYITVSAKTSKSAAFPDSIRKQPKSWRKKFLSSQTCHFSYATISPDLFKHPAFVTQKQEEAATTTTFAKRLLFSKMTENVVSVSSAVLSLSVNKCTNYSVFFSFSCCRSCF
jgi:hypothetical protein